MPGVTAAPAAPAGGSATPSQKSKSSLHASHGAVAGTAAPGWTLSRPYLTFSYLSEPRGADADAASQAPISSFPLAVQETLAVNDLLSILIGIDAKYIHIKCSSDRLSVTATADRSMDLSLADLIDRILPLATYYVRVVRFIEMRQHYEFGLVNHALCAAMQELVREYLILVAQLETQANAGKLTLQKMWFYVQPTMRTMRVLSELVAEVSNAAAKAGGKSAVRGGALLNILTAQEVSSGGEEQAGRILGFLVEKASQPYLEMLTKWVYLGKVDDPYSEFMVQEKPYLVIHEDTYWEKRYAVRDAQVPSFLNSKDVIHKIITTGKYLTVIRECGEGGGCPHARPITFSHNDRVYAELVGQAYHYASETVLRLLMEKNSLLDRLESVKHYFLVDQGDWLVHFLDTAEEELCKDVGSIRKDRLESMLQLSLVTSIASTDAYRDDVGCDLMNCSALDEVLHVISIDGLDKNAKARPFDATSDAATALNGLESFTLAYKVDWPLNVVLSKATLTKYRWLFRHLFSYKCIERELCSAWTIHQGTKSLDSNRSFSVDFALRRRMQHFIQSLHHYLVMDVVENSWHTFKEAMRHVSTVDDVLRTHDRFLGTCIKHFMLNDPQLLKQLSRTVATCDKFAKYIKSKTPELKLAERGEEGEAGQTGRGTPAEARARRREITRAAAVLSADQGYRDTVAKYETEFDDKITLLLESLRTFCIGGGDPHLLNLCNQLDYNKYYSDRM